MPNKLKIRIESRERRKGIISREIILGNNDLSKCSEDKLKVYLKYLQNPESYQKSPENSVVGKILDDTPVVKDSISDLSDKKPAKTFTLFWKLKDESRQSLKGDNSVDIGEFF
jgi:hypothetical protein